MTLTERHFLKVALEIHDQLARQPANAREEGLEGVEEG